MAIGLLVIGGATAAFAQNGGSYATALESLTVNPSSVKGGANAYALVHLNQPVPSGTFRVALYSSNTGAATIKEAVLFQAGQQDKSVLVSTYAVAADTDVNISGTDQDGNTASDTLTVRAVTLYRFRLNIYRTYGGNTPPTGTLVLDGPAPVGGVDVNLSSSNSAAASVPTPVHIAAGTTSSTFMVTTYPVSSDTPVVLTAMLSGVTKTRQLKVLAPDVSSMDVTPNVAVNGGQSNVMGHVSLTGPAPAGYTASISSTDSSVASVPATITFGAGSKREDFGITVGHPLNFTTATISATAGGVVKSDLIHVKGLHIAVRFADGTNNTITNAPVGTQVNLRILLSDVANGDEPITLVSSNSSRILVPATSKIIDGHSERSILVTVGPGTGPVTITVTLTHNGDVAHASFNVDP